MCFIHNHPFYLNYLKLLITQWVYKHTESDIYFSDERDMKNANIVSQINFPKIFLNEY